MMKLNEDLAAYLLKQCPARTRNALQERFAISYNTLRKIEAGLPIRGSLAERLEQRLRVEIAMCENRT